MPVYLASVKGLNSLQIGQYIMVTGLFQLLSAFVAGPLAKRIDSRLMLAGNGIEIVTDTAYIYDGSTVSVINDPDLVPWSAVDFVDGYIVAVESGSGRFVCSNLYDASSYDALNFATAEGAPDNLVTLKVDHRQVILFGTSTTEIWWNSGAASFPFERLSGGFVEIGCIARLGVAKADNSVFWLASDRTIRRLSGTTPVRVSQHGVEEALSRYTTVDDCEAFTYTWDGHIFVVFRFPTEGATWVLDVTTGEWHERETYGDEVWQVCGAATIDGRAYVLNAETGAIGYLSDTTYQEYGGILRREVTYPAVYKDGARMFHSQIDLIMRTGDAPTGEVPYITAQISDDGGTTWTALPDRALGEVGQYRNVIRWNQLGYARDRVYRFACANAVPFHIIDTTLVAAGGAQ